MEKLGRLLTRSWPRSVATRSMLCDVRSSSLEKMSFGTWASTTGAVPVMRDRSYMVSGSVKIIKTPVAPVRAHESQKKACQVSWIVIAPAMMEPTVEPALRVEE